MNMMSDKAFFHIPPFIREVCTRFVAVHSAGIIGWSCYECNTGPISCTHNDG